MPDGRIYMLQPSFASGEISPDVASRVDIDKYQSALLQAENVFIRPYGSAYRRPGTEYVADLGSWSYPVLLQEFAVDADTSYLLVFTPSKLKIYKDGNLIDTKNTPYIGYDLHKLRFAQSADVMFIASGQFPVQVLTRTGTDTFSNLSAFDAKPPYMDDTTMTDGTTIKPSATSGTVTLTASTGVFSSGQVGNWVQLRQEVDSLTRSMTLTSSSGTPTSFDSGNILDVDSISLSITGTWTGSCDVKVDGNTVQTFTSNTVYESTLAGDNTVRITGSVSSGTITINLIYRGIDEYNVPFTKSTTIRRSATAATSASMLAGAEGWKVTSHGTWSGSFDIEYSDDNSNWKTLRTYNSNDDFNVTESGTFDEPTYIRIAGSITSGSCRVDLTRLTYTHEGTAKITAYTNSTKVTAKVEDNFANTNAADDWAFGAWSDVYGYPSCVTFFQDRLCFAANDRQPYMVWMSRTGDYYNFGAEKVDGTLTDDSAVAISFITRKDYRILHLMAHADLLVMTEGNEWIVNGNEVVTPTNISPRVQTSRGSTEVVPEMIGGQMIYVQRHGKTVRDLQYNFGTDSYDGMDLTILAKHITQDRYIVDSAYRQEPDYMMFYVLDDGTAACLTYVKEQQVYAWCRMKTQGIIYAVETVSTPYYDDVYFVVARQNGWYLEKLSNYPHYEWPHDYVMMDCAMHGEEITPAINTATIPQFANMDVELLADGRRIPNVKADGNGVITWEVPAENVCIGLKYTSTWELPNIEMQLRDGTLQGRRKKVSEVILRLDNSLGGRVGMSTDKTDIIKYDELQKEDVVLFSGEKLVTVPNVNMGGFNDKGRVVVVSDDPYPLSISSIVRAVVPGG